MKLNLSASLLVGLFSFIISSAVATAADSSFTKEYQKYVDDGSVPGAVCIVATPTEILSMESVGWADVDSKTPIDENSYFWIASNSKAVIAAAAMICVDEGLLDLDVPVEEYLPQLKDLKVGRQNPDGSVLLVPAASKPTLRQALSHTAGLRFITAYQERYGIDSLPVSRLMTTVGMSALIEDPGVKYSYSNLGIDVAQAAVEAVTGMPFEKFLQERIFDPLEMTDTTFYPSEEQLKRLATPYGWNRETKALQPIRFGQMPSMDDGSPRFAEGGGGLFSSAKDFIKFYQMLGGKGVGANGKRILSESAVETMSTKQTGDSVDVAYGFGLTVSEASYGHGGAYGTQGVVYRDSGVVAVYMVAVAGLPKQGEAEGVFRRCAEATANASEKK